jgi:5-methylthioadenosine/S-adenosylhomocysteine deaminase
MRAGGARPGRRDIASFLAFPLLALLPSLLLLAAAPAEREPVDLLISNARVVTVDAKGSVFDPGAVAIRKGGIVAVGPAPEVAARFSPRSTFDARGRIVMPGLVNTHTHAAMTLLRGVADDMPLDRWLHEKIFPAEAKNVSREFVYDGTLLAALEMIRGGTTTFADMYYFEEDAARAVEKAGLRAVLGETWIDFPVPDHKDLAESIAYTDAFVRRWKGNARVIPAVAPHSSYTCSKETLLAARDFAIRQGVPILTHLAETTKERENALARWGRSPVAYEEEIGFYEGTGASEGVPVVAAHCVAVDEADRAILKRRGVAVSHNPESNMKLASGIAPVAAMAREGVLWSLGTDGPAGSNNDLSMMEAMDFAGKLAKVSTGDPTVLPAPDLVIAATRSGAAALGLDEKIGSLEPGKRADLIVLEVRNAHVEPFTDLFSTIVYSAKTSDVTDVWVEGVRLLENRRPTTLDERAILDSAIRWRRKIEASLAPAKAAEP